MSEARLRKPRVLVATPTPLLPLDSGGRLYTWRLAEAAAHHAHLHLLATATDDERAQHPGDAAYASVFRSVTIVDRPPLPAERSAVGALAHLVRHARLGLPLMDLSYFSEEAVAVARQLVGDGEVDILQADHLHMAFMRRFLPDVPAVLVTHNIESELHPFWPSTRWSQPMLSVWKAFGRLSRRNGRRIEIENSLAFDSMVFISPDDARRVSADVSKSVIPFPAEVSGAERQGPDGPLRLLWLGGFDWPPNAEAMRWFGSLVWPLLDHDAVELDVVGRDPPPDVRSLLTGARFHGWVDDVEPYRSAADALIAPLQSGGGVRVKLVEAMADGLPVVTTPKGCEGLGVKHDVHVLVAERPDEFAVQIHRLADDPTLRARIGTNARAHIAAEHAPERAGRQLAAVYEQLVRPASGPAPRGG